MKQLINCPDLDYRWKRRQNMLNLIFYLHRQSEQRRTKDHTSTQETQPRITHKYWYELDCVLFPLF